MKRIEKKHVYLHGTLLTPLAVGSCAFISHRGQLIRTTRVVAVHGLSDHQARFETLNSYYCVEFSPVPANAAKPVYSLIAA